MLFVCFQALGQINLHPSSKEICSGSSTKLIVGTAISGSSFQWQDSTALGWVNLNNSTIFSGVTDDTLLINNQTQSINSKRFRCLVDSGSLNIRVDTSLSASIKVLPSILSPSIGSSQTICFKTQADTIKMLMKAKGADDQFTYQWQSSTNGTSWSNVTGYTGDSLLTGALTVSMYYRIRAVS
jgi:hypothetical protein